MEPWRHSPRLRVYWALAVPHFHIVHSVRATLRETAPNQQECTSGQVYPPQNLGEYPTAVSEHMEPICTTFRQVTRKTLLRDSKQRPNGSNKLCVTQCTARLQGKKLPCVTVEFYRKKYRKAWHLPNAVGA